VQDVKADLHEVVEKELDVPQLCSQKCMPLSCAVRIIRA